MTAAPARRAAASAAMPPASSPRGRPPAVPPAPVFAPPLGGVAAWGVGLIQALADLLRQLQGVTDLELVGEVQLRVLGGFLVVQAVDGEALPAPQTDGTVASFMMEGAREVSYWIDPARWGEGLASAALGRVLADGSDPAAARPRSATQHWVGEGSCSRRFRANWRREVLCQRASGEPSSSTSISSSGSAAAPVRQSMRSGGRRRQAP